MKPIIRMTKAEVLALLKEHMPCLLPHIEEDRNWLWYTGESLKDFTSAREVLKQIGFRFKTREGSVHICPSGKSGSWAHHCMHPVKTKFGKGGGTKPGASKKQPPAPKEPEKKEPEEMEVDWDLIEKLASQ